jgi:hypothetical protein
MLNWNEAPGLVCATSKKYSSDNDGSMEKLPRRENEEKQKNSSMVPTKLQILT